MTAIVAGAVYVLLPKLTLIFILNTIKCHHAQQIILRELSERRTNLNLLPPVVQQHLAAVSVAANSNIASAPSINQEQSQYYIVDNKTQPRHHPLQSQTPVVTANSQKHAGAPTTPNSGVSIMASQDAVFLAANPSSGQTPQMSYHVSSTETSNNARLQSTLAAIEIQLQYRAIQPHPNGSQFSMTTPTPNAPLGAPNPQNIAYDEHMTSGTFPQPVHDLTSHMSMEPDIVASSPPAIPMDEDLLASMEKSTQFSYTLFLDLTPNDYPMPDEEVQSPKESTPSLTSSDEDQTSEYSDDLEYALNPDQFSSEVYYSHDRMIT